MGQEAERCHHCENFCLPSVLVETRQAWNPTSQRLDLRGISLYHHDVYQVWVCPCNLCGKAKLLTHQQVFELLAGLCHEMVESPLVP